MPQVLEDPEGKPHCCLCAAPLEFPVGGGMMPPLLGDYFVCNPCFDAETQKKEDLSGYPT